MVRAIKVRLFAPAIGVSFFIGLLFLLCFIQHIGHGQSVPLSCVNETCVFSTNIPYDAEGAQDTRPGTWGEAAYSDVTIPFQGVPAGYRVRILRVYGDFIAWPHGQIKPHTAAGTLFGLITSSAIQSPYVGPGLGSKGCFVYLQEGVGAGPVRAAFNYDTSAGGLLDPDNLLIVRRAVWLNETGVSIHLEPTFIVEFRYEPGSVRVGEAAVKSSQSAGTLE
jgi:hypothetical protein